MAPPPPTAPGILTRRAPAGPAFAADLHRHGDAVAAVAGGRSLSYLELAERADELADRLGPTRRLVAVDPANALGALVAELAALRGGHPALVLPGGPHRDAVLDRYRPDVVVTPDGDDCRVEEHHPTTGHRLHPELALLLSTSGSTGSPKLVRLSAANLQTNAEAIVAYLGLGADDRAITSLPMSYCYGLSVVHTHLQVGGGVVVTDRSVVDPCFWRSFTDEQVTGLAGVPHTFELLERVGFAEMDLPSLRRVTQAGGRMAPDRVRRLAALGRRRGWDLFVMYGQTEATARMAYLPPDRAEDRPEAIGIPIPGGSFVIDPVPDDPHRDGRGELVYRGPNVMLGYAETPEGLALGRTVDELRTGDLARRGDDGLYEIMGRAARFVKPFGLRVDLDRVERLLASAGHRALCSGDDEHLAIAVEHPADPATVARLAAGGCGLPAGAVRVAAVDDLPRLPTGKPDHQAVRRLAAATPRPGPVDPGPVAPVGRRGRRRGASAPREVLADVLDVADVPDDATFVGLGGDSLSYVEVSVRLEDVLDRVPPDWHVRPVAELDDLPRRHRGMRSIETGVVVRALAVVAVVAAHTGVVDLVGGAHLLLLLAGWNFARFPLRAARDDRDDRAPVPPTAILRSLARVAVPTVLFVGTLTLVLDTHTWANAALVNNYAADGVWRYWYWFVEVLAQVLVVVAVALAVPAVRRLEARRPFAFALGLLALTLAVATVPMGDPANDIYRTHSVAFLFVLGWLACLATTAPTRVLVGLLAAVAVPLLLDEPSRQLVVVGGLALLLWWPRVPVVAPVARLAAVVASASLWIYLTHWQVLPLLQPHLPPAAVTAVAVAVGVGAWSTADRVGRRVRGWWAPRRQTPSSWRRMSRTARTVPATVPVTFDRPALRR